MSELTEARIVHEEGESREPLPEAAILAPDRLRRVVAAEAEARALATKLLRDANAEAVAIVARARAEAVDAAEIAGREARETEHTKVAALYLALRYEQEHRAEKDLQRVVDLAIVLAERLLGEALKDEPRRVITLAEQALREARGARKAVIEACPLDAALLQHHLDTIGFAPHTVELKLDPTLPRGSLRVETNLGILDAQLRPQLERLARTLQDALGRPPA